MFGWAALDAPARLTQASTRVPVWCLNGWLRRGEHGLAVSGRHRNPATKLRSA